LNSGRNILFIASGKEKASVVKAAFEKSADSLPVHKIIPEDGKVTWLLDREAASLLPSDISNDH
jgi:6-phosphogluconolactonase/glucosamine-6-phosphate isomerase/deaminase